MKIKDALEKSNKIWDEIFIDLENEEIIYDDWLDMFSKEIQECKTPIIDLGCGRGNDTLYLIQNGKEVIPCDYSKNAIQNIKKNFPQVKRVECFDMTKGLPFEDNFTDIIICDLSLHYFTKEITLQILNEIRRVLKPNGMLFCRVNSINDVNFGAGQGEEIEPHLYLTQDGIYKRFFDMNDIEKIFAGWNKISINEEKLNRYSAEKIIWKCVLKVNKK